MLRPIEVKRIMNNWLITGGAGFIGQNLTEKLLTSKEGIHIVVIDNLSSSNMQSKDPSRRNRSLHNGSLKFFKADIRDKDALVRIIGDEKIDVCVHLAAKVGVPESIKNPEETIDVNVKGTCSLLEACSDNRVKTFIFASSAAVYGRIQSLPVSEKHVPEPLSAYGASKVAGEALVSAYGNTMRIKNAVSLRIFNVYGRNQTSRYAGVVTKFISRLNKGMPPIIYGNGKQTRDFIAVEDVVNSILAAGKLFEKTAEQKKELTSEHRQEFPSNCHNIFNIGSGIPTTIYSLAKTIIKIYGADLRPLFRDNTNNGEIKYIYPDISKAERCLGFRAEENLERGIKNVLKL
jgi:UDP-glucose 4-epimerase